MSLPEPKPGLVIAYAYLWREEHSAGRSEGRKDRPCVIVLAVETRAGMPLVTVAAITHSPPRGKDEAVELPAETKQRLNLDAAKSWIVTAEVNQFVWPGTDLRPISRAKPGSFAYGRIPRALLLTIRQQIIRRGRVATVRRED